MTPGVVVLTLVIAVVGLYVLDKLNLIKPKEPGAPTNYPDLNAFEDELVKTLQTSLRADSSGPIAVTESANTLAFISMKKRYIDGPVWDVKRKERLKLDNYTCQGCGASGVSLDVHHENGYSLIPHEPLLMLKSLCRRCHDAEHTTHGFPQGYEGYKNWNHPITKRI